jgi:hypothetical protein
VPMEHSPLADLFTWLGDHTASALWEPFALWGLGYIYRKVKQILSKRAEREVAPPERNMSRFAKFRRKLKLSEFRFLRRYRFDTVWISREVSRGHTCQLIFVLWFGLWLIAIGLKDVFFISSEATLGKSPSTIITSATPMYIFEVGWLYYSGRAARLIQHRQKIKAWRFRL